MRTVGVVTVGRSDYGIYLPVLRALQADPALNLHLIVAGMHWLESFGNTHEEIERDGFSIGAKVCFTYQGDEPEHISATVGNAVGAFAHCYQETRPDILLVLGDRFEMHAAVMAAIPFKIPIAHIHGGELTQGAIDNVLRHSITQCAHLHFATTEEYACRIRQMGEEPWRVVVSGAPAIDNLKYYQMVSLNEMAEKFHIDLTGGAPFLVTFHPVTLEYEQTEWQIHQVLQALSRFPNPVIFTGVNGDTRNSVIWRKLKEFVEQRSNSHLITNFGVKYYFSMMAASAVMIGNSSSGLVEAASFELPVVNIGIRQRGRVRSRNVIDVGYGESEIVHGIGEALSPDFRESLRGLVNPYGQGCAAEIIVAVLKNVELGQGLLLKTFTDCFGKEIL